jgi:hypothetical protein
VPGPARSGVASGHNGDVLVLSPGRRFNAADHLQCDDQQHDPTRHLQVFDGDLQVGEKRFANRGEETKDQGGCHHRDEGDPVSRPLGLALGQRQERGDVAERLGEYEQGDQRGCEGVRHATR